MVGQGFHVRVQEGGKPFVAEETDPQPAGVAKDEREAVDHRLHRSDQEAVIDKFGPLPAWAEARLRQVDTPQEAEGIIRRLGDARSIADALGEPPAS